ncbi:glycosyltransferase [Limnoraphis robusta]|uniref:Glycosyltransferase n=1 Tax=Limnoraphis robusta CCNP1315 TaxID=3110306 RepID=A0ABU5U2M8_9CYAN|nr:glycosyltransferase [Limnoraphis robusta]MEA5521452.1 glycosyltransferase [Limnoraphis robusta CCNP1315]MEA5546465.1 glycosyltransferase [Limnoraphis robusta CCNP1324]
MSTVMETPLVSVIIPVYNGSRYLSQAVESVLSQTDCQFEVIVVDDGSTDNTSEILQHYSDRIRYFFQKNQGVAAARNRGIQEAKAEFIALLDQDDLFLPDKLAEQIACFETFSEVGFVNSGWRLIDREGNPISDIEPWHNLPNLDLQTLIIHSPILPSSMMFRRTWWEKVGGFDSRFNGVDDAEFVWRLAVAGCQAIWLQKITVEYRQHEQTVSNQKAVERAETLIAAQNYFFSQSHLSDAVRQLEKPARYQELTWLAWHLYYTKNYQNMAEYLHKSLAYTPDNIPITISDWIKRFTGHCNAYGEQFNLESFRKLPQWQQLISSLLPSPPPKVSVIIPAYNCEQYIEQAVKSVLEQTYTDYELIVINDGSTDNTKQILSAYLDVIRYIYQPNQGAAKARNHGCKLAKGQFLAFLDGDDFFTPNKLAEQVNFFEQDSTIDLVQSGWMMVNKTGENLADITPWKDAPELNLETWLLHKCVRPSALIIRKIWWEKVGGFDHRYPPTEDLDFVLRLALMGCKAVWLKAIHAGYRQHDSNLMSGGERVIKNTELLMNQFFNRRDIPENIQQLKQKEHYQRWVWLAWRMYRDGYSTLMTDCFKKSLNYTSDFKANILTHWIKAFSNISAEYGEPFDAQKLMQSPEWQQAVTYLMSKTSFENSQNLSRKQHILLMNTDDPGIGGLAQYDHLIMCQLAKMGYKVTAIRPQHSSPLVEQEQQLGIQQYWLEYSTSQDLSRILRNTKDAEEIYAKFQPDFIIFSDGWPFSHFAAKQVAIQQNIPYMIALGLATPEHKDFTMGDNIPYVEGVLYQYGLAKAVNVAAKEHLNILNEQFKLPKNKGNVIYYGRSEKYFSPPNPSTRQRLRQEIGIPDDGIMCFTSARLAPIKGHRYQLEAIAQLKQTSIWNKLYFVWAGTGQGSDHNLEPELQEKVQKIGVSNQVKLLGQRWDIPDWLEACDIFILTSLAEAAPSFAVMEAMAKGVPIIASAAGGIPEGLGDTGQLLPDPNFYPEDTVKVLVETLKEWAINPEIRQKKAIAAKQRAEQLFKEERMLKETLEVIEQALSDDSSNNFADLPHVKKGVKNLNQRLEYAGQVWNAWNAYRQGNEEQMKRYLQQALKCSPFSFSTEILLDWIDDFSRLFQQKGEQFDIEDLSQCDAWKNIVENDLRIPR